MSKYALILQTLPPQEKEQAFNLFFCAVLRTHLKPPDNREWLGSGTAPFRPESHCPVIAWKYYHP